LAWCRSCGRNVTRNGTTIPKDMTKLEEGVLIAALLSVAIFFALRDASAAAGVAYRAGVFQPDDGPGEWPPLPTPREAA
jgi:hypothetical protein